MSRTLDFLADSEQFAHRHIGPDERETGEMLQLLGYPTLAALVDAAVPPPIRLKKSLALPPARSEFQALAELKRIAGENKVFRSFIGQGYHDTITPPVIQRNVLENPGWYTQYTPYQAEISQGRLEALLNFQTMVTDLTGMDIANASLLDEATACAEAMTMSARLKEGRRRFLVSDSCHPQNIEVVQTRARALGLEVHVGNPETFDLNDQVMGVLVQYPDTYGVIHDFTKLSKRVKEGGALLIVAADLLALTLLKPPGEFGADMVVGSAQRFGVPMGYGGPHAAFFATRNEFKRHMPGRIVGVSRDSRGKPALRLALGTREQHIRREKATSNICTAQALLANMASLYAVYHGPEGLKSIATRIHRLTASLAGWLVRKGFRVENDAFFDTLTVVVPEAEAVHRAATACGINFRILTGERVGITLDETCQASDLALIASALTGQKVTLAQMELPEPANHMPPFARRLSTFLTHKVFNSHHCETEMLRYIKRLESRDLSLTASMIPLGSCTMKLNAAAEMLPVSWPEFSRLHPFAPLNQARGYQILFQNLEDWLEEITGFAGISLQPNAGSQGEYAGLLVIRAYLESCGQSQRNICLIPTSAHGTNPASAVMAGMKVVAVACDANGNIDMADLRAKADAHRESLSCLMITYPSTHGVFEETIREMCEVIHSRGGQVYMDGANLNAQVGLTSPGCMGADVCHLNLHKTFCIPHGGGGPGVGPIGVASHLVPFLPSHPFFTGRLAKKVEKPHIGPVSGAPWGSASILPISWMYIAMMGAQGLVQSTGHAILNANYVAARLQPFFPTLYRNRNLVAHECILDLRAFHLTTAEDVAKRLMDYGFHAPTLSWPVAGTLMVEPTESESKKELDRFCDAMIAIHAEMVEVESGRLDAQANMLKLAPHTADQVAGDVWDRPYTRMKAAFPSPHQLEYKFWPHVGRIDNVFGDRNPVCSCVGMEEYA